MKKWELELMSVMAKSNVDNMQKDVVEYVNKMFQELNTQIETMYEKPPTNEDTWQEGGRMGKNRIVLDVSEILKKNYIKD